MSATGHLVSSSRPPRRQGRRAGFLPEVQALRAVAVLLVLAFHLWPDALTGGFVGVDVFFGISGFLITSHLVRELDERGTIDLTRFWARRIRRLLPAALLVLTVTAVAVIAFVPSTQWQQIFGEIRASALYAQNWWLGYTAIDYFATNDPASPVQHYWSLSVEEQFYLVWPLLLLAALFAVRAVRRRGRPDSPGGSSAGRNVGTAVLAMAAVVGVASLVHSIQIAYDDPEFGYFSTFSHAWEFALGAVIAGAGPALIARVRQHRHLQAAASWLGFAMIGFAGWAFTGGTPFPGYVALLPLIGTVLVIVAGQSDAGWSPARWVAARPVQYVGDISYSLYLWHWPLIVVPPYLLEAHLSFAGTVVAGALSFVAAAATKVLVEDRLRTASWLASSRRRTYVAAAMASVLLAGTCVVPSAMVSHRQQQGWAQAPAIESDPCFGAAAVDRPSCPVDHRVDPVLGPEFAIDDDVTHWLQRNVEPQYADTEHCQVVIDTVQQCRFEPVAPQDTFTIAVVGDSHARVLLSPVLIAARANGWQVLMFWNGGCRAVQPTFVSPDPGERVGECVAWQRSVVRHITDRRDIDAVVTSGWTRQYARRLHHDPARMRPIAEAFDRTWRQWSDSGKDVVVVPDVPDNAQWRVVDCIAMADTDVDPCALPPHEAVATDPVDMALQRVPDSSRVRPLDLTHYFCDDELCHFVVGGAITTRDGHHLTAMFANSLVPTFTRVLRSLER